ncbi:MAG: sensor histidine kinase [Gemmataceae bacterium]
MNPEELLARYREMQDYVGWNESHAATVASLAEMMQPAFEDLVDDFYQEIQRHETSRSVITGGTEQIHRLKRKLVSWLEDLFCGIYDQEYVQKRWLVGCRHVEIGLDQVFTNVALSRLRRGLFTQLRQRWKGDGEQLAQAQLALNMLLDLDLALIEDSYQTEHLARQHRVERLAAIGQVAGGVAHELRNPLNVVKTSVYYLLNASQLSPQKRDEHLQRIERHVTLADGVITAMSKFARLPVPARLPFSLRECIQTTLETNLATDSIHVESNLAEDLPLVLADPDQIGIVIGNLIRNARDAMPNGGKLTFSGRVEGDHLELDVCDTGVGIPPDLLSKIMEPLVSTKARGLGLGLAIARTILEKNGGSLRVASELGRGSTFTVRLPFKVNL